MVGFAVGIIDDNVLLVGDWAEITGTLEIRENQPGAGTEAIAKYPVGTAANNVLGRLGLDIAGLKFFARLDAQAVLVR